jgi:hypothetical protein
MLSQQFWGQGDGRKREEEENYVRSEKKDERTT